ncbi:MAG TPA: alpha/beta fold hydrolase [Candidatus Nanoarchaeia archaeon]|nr:alpha/beta fold hydrolase [Candidatus Nanoarchaeia archaeon]
MKNKPKIKKIKIYSNHQKIDGTLFLPEKISKKIGGVIFFHGMTSGEKGYLAIAEKLSEAGIAALTVNFRGHGTSAGNFASLTIGDAFSDGIKAYDFFVRQKIIDKQKIGICGSSLGSAIAAMVSSQKNVCSLVLRVPATYTDEMMQLTYEEIMADEKNIFQKISNPGKTQSIQSLKEFTGSLLIITSEHDYVIPAIIPKSYITGAKRAIKKELYKIKGATHNLSRNAWRKEFINKTISWFKKTL